MWNQDKYTAAWRFACEKHLSQTVPGTDLPYVNHVGNVAMEVMAALSAESCSEPDLAVLCALLHDTVEDTQTSVEELVEYFGNDVAQGVSALSKDSRLGDKRTMMLDSLGRIKSCPGEVWMVKLADRIVNLQPPPSYWTEEKIRAYRDEAELILEELGGASTVLRERLRNKIDNYARYLES